MELSKGTLGFNQLIEALSPKKAFAISLVKISGGSLEINTIGFFIEIDCMTELDSWCNGDWQYAVIEKAELKNKTIFSSLCQTWFKYQTNSFSWYKINKAPDEMKNWSVFL